MKLRVIREAEEEAQQAVVWYDERSPGLGDDFLKEFASALEQIEETPLRFPILETTSLRGQIRRCPLTRFPFIVIYETLRDETIVLAVAHVSRRPHFWQGRR